MSPSYSQNKSHIYNWRKKNHETYNKISAKNMVKYRSWKKIQSIFLNIVLDI